MRISRIHVYRHELPVAGGTYKMANTSVCALDTTLVEIVTDTGLCGYGESCPVGPVYQPMHALGVRSALEQIGPHLVGQNPLHIGCVHDAMEGALNGFRYAKAAVDIALWDIAGKAYGARVCELLGGARQDPVPSYYALGVMAPEEAASVAREKQAQGFRRLQVKVGGREPEEDIAVIRKVSEGLQYGVRLAVDANRGWTTRDAMRISQACRDLYFVIEQPCNTYEETAALRGRIFHPVYLDESTEGLEMVLRAAGDRACDGFGLKVTRLGGLSAMRTARDVCRSANLPMTCDDSWGGDIIAAACTHIGATVHPALMEGVWIAGPYIDGHYDPANGIAIEDGGIRIPEGPGLGIVPDTSAWGPPVLSFG
jgi:L-alanine-DL-glutamate epimerase-like enolase superfamily enzyme